ncbi:MAG: NADPH-dependent glutamate synthase [Promethearchaeota archaeon]
MRKYQINNNRTPMPVQDHHERIHNFDEVAQGYTEEMALAEANRCIQCKTRPCVKGCPVEVPIPEFIKLLAEKNFEGAIDKIKEKNVLPAICGRVCPQESQCEVVCTLGKIKGSKPVAIGRLERYVADWEQRVKGIGEFDEGACVDFSGNPKVAIIGAGPAGLTCAGELAKLEYDVTIFEAFHKTGGVLVYGIPEFRLPKEIVRKEIDNLRECGVKIRLNSVIGQLFDLKDLEEQGFQAFFIAVGAGLPIFLKVPGIELNGVLSANEYLTRVNLMKAYRKDYDTMVDEGDTIAVLGGGNVTMDSARTALRLGTKKVIVVYRRSEAEIPARREEYEHAVEEGVEFHFLRNPTKIIGDDKGFVKEMEVIKMKLGEPDASGRRRPIEIPGSEYTIPVDLVIMAIGTRANPLLTQNTKGLQLNKWGYIEVNKQMQTSIPNVFAGGDIVTGSATVISAMGAGKDAAKSIHKYMQEKLNSTE